MPAYVQPIAIRFRDIDALDHVNHAVVLTYCETVRCDWFQGVAGYPSMAGLPFILASAHVEYQLPIPKDAKLEVAMWVSRFGSKSWDFGYEVREGGTGKLFATVKTVQVGYDYKAAKTIAPPPRLRALLETLQA
ncbi:MAG TPA: thioesterase family protein [Candidatus Thermoplasmatota archaeon]|nr:thioesterase family protein [Candidatus Thermoplasmatota archaeon]